MQIKESIESGVAVLTFKGDLLGEPETTMMREKIASLVGDNIKHAIIDLGGVNYMNSSGLGALISAHTTMRNAGGELSLARIGDKVQNLFIITKLVKIFDTYETVERALASAKARQK